MASPPNSDRSILMRTSYLLTALLVGLFTISLQAGQEVYKQVAPPPPELYGLGFYGAIDMGANIYQNRGGDRTFTDDNPNSPFFGDTLEISPKNDVGFYGGVKLGYVFGTGVVRPTIEGDFFYNGFRGGANFALNKADGDLIAQRNVTTWINTGAFMANFILRFAPGNQRFQPYAGAGVGAYYAQSDGLNVQVDDLHFRARPATLRENLGTNAFADLAWQVVAGSDYYWTPKISTFIEYHFLNYTSDTLIAVRDADTRRLIRNVQREFDLDLKQHLVGAGLRFHF